MEFDWQKYKRVIEENFDIINLRGERVPFMLNDVQVHFMAHITGEDIVLKARQKGMTALILAIFTVDFIFRKYSNSLTIAQDQTMIEKLFRRVKLYIESFEQKNGVKLVRGYDSKTQITNADNGANFYVGSAGSSNIGRSDTLTNVHFSEFSAYERPRDVYLSASQAGHPRLVFIESTARGEGNLYHEFWKNATATPKKSNLTAHFYGWNTDPECVMFMNESEALTVEEQQLVTRYKLSREQIAWRRRKLLEFAREEDFKQEHPISPEEAFITSGNPVFNIRSLDWYRNDSKWQKDPIRVGRLVGFRPPVFEEQAGSYLSIFKMPERDGEYVIGADTCGGTSVGDYACAQVIDRKSCEQVAVWHGRVEPDVLGKELYKLGMWYNLALLAPERNNHGIATIQTLRESEYANLYVRERMERYDDKIMPEFGFETNMKTKPELVRLMQEAVRNKMLMIHDKPTIDELFSYQFDDRGHANAGKGAHDDRVIALMIALLLYNRTPYSDISNNSITREERFVEENNLISNDEFLGGADYF